MKAPDLEDDEEKGSESRWSEAALEFAYNRQELQKFIDRDPLLQILRPRQIGTPKGPVAAPTASENKLDLVKGLLSLLKETGLVASPFDADELFDLAMEVIQSSAEGLFGKLKSLVGEIPTDQDPTAPDPRTSPQIGSTGYRTASPYLSAAEPGSDSSSEPRRMSLGPSGAAMLEARVKEARPERPKSRSRKQKPTAIDRTANATRTEESTDKLESYFQFLMEQQQASTRRTTPVETPNVGSQDVEMESTGSHDPTSSHWEYDPDDVDLSLSARAVVATAVAGPANSSMIQRVRISAISDLKEFTGRDQDEDRARSWISKVKSAFLRDQATDEEKCLTFADLLSGPAKNWYRQLARSTRNKWSELLRNFQVQYCGLGVSVAWQYYHSRKRSEESPLEYHYRLNVAALRAKLKIKDGDSKTRREHVEHFIETLGDPDLADRLTLLRLNDVEDLEEVLGARDRAKGRQKRSAFGSKYRQKTSTPAPAAPAKRSVHAVQRSAPEPGSDTVSDGSDSEGDLRRIYLASAENKEHEAKDEAQPVEPAHRGKTNPDSPRPRSQQDGLDRNVRCSHCGSRKHTDLGCWRRLTCEKCGKRGHPAQH
ncbi:hypothetical protein PF007_g26219 [Phytophthora fragariae]|uniref:CCHC-type domain-containing protein n=1 Tax=Phytophthora fragariae TaxID=53985 RepID=A0A6A3QAN8_9STRA|nr:hypothetical protein PF007_g26219 [Phytophthora fragariae]